MQQPPSLQKGDTVAIVSTARKISKEEIQPAIELLEEWGLHPVLGKTIGLEQHQFAGDDTQRAADFQTFMDDPTVKAIWCAKGGYGTVRIIDALNFSKFRKAPKWVIGYSDITVLHAHLHSLGIATLHAQIAENIGNKSALTRETLKKALFGEKYHIESIPNNNSLLREGSAKGVLVGGNLSILYSLCGSVSSIDTQGKILFLEDLDEYLYHVDRMMQNLKRNGMLEHLKGLVVGGMTKMHDNIIPFGKSAEEIIFDTVSEYAYPVCFHFPAGHMEDNRALVLGREIHLEVTKQYIRLAF
jgi:muramoyltetrapeptide carboxypeptidase